MLFISLNNINLLLFILLKPGLMMLALTVSVPIFLGPGIGHPLLVRDTQVVLLLSGTKILVELPLLPPLVGPCILLYLWIMLLMLLFLLFIILISFVLSVLYGRNSLESPPPISPGLHW